MAIARALADMPADEIVAAVHPYDEYSQQHTRTAALEIAELMRYLNHVTLRRPADAVPDPNTQATVLAALHTTAACLPQLLQQLRARMRAFAANPALAADSRNSDTSPVVAASCLHALEEAVQALGPLTAGLARAHQAAARLYLASDDEDD